MKLMRRVDTKATSGQVKHTYTEIATVWARIKPLSGREFFAAAQVQADATTRIEIRYRTDIDATCRIEHTVQYASPEQVDSYDIVVPPMPDEKTGRRELHLICKKNPAEGRYGP